MANKYFKRNGVPSNATYETIYEGQIAHPEVVKHTTKVEPDKGKKQPDKVDDRIKYNNVRTLKQILGNIVQALRQGHLVLCGVLSGILDDSKKKFPNPEHYILLFSYEKIEDEDTFVFWDSDPTCSNISVFDKWGTSFGVVFFNTKEIDTITKTPFPMFSTACDLDDLNRVSLSGDHQDVTRRHRYQVYYVQTLGKVQK